MQALTMKSVLLGALLQQPAHAEKKGGRKAPHKVEGTHRPTRQLFQVSPKVFQDFCKSVSEKYEKL